MSHSHYSFFFSSADEFDITIGGRKFFINPAIHLNLEAYTRVPMDLTSNISVANDFDFAGTFDAKLNVGVAGIPAELYISASSDDITKVYSVEFDIGVDIDLRPLNDTLMDSMTKLSKISYTEGGVYNKDLVSFLPRLDIICVSKSATAYLLKGNADGNYPLSGFINSIAKGCSSKDIKLSGGYNSTSEELGM